MTRCFHLRPFLCAVVACALLAAPRLPARADALASPPALDPTVAAAVGAVSAERLRATDARLVGFGTRNLFATLPSRTRGVLAARDWIAAQFRAIAAASGGRMTVAFDDYEQPPTKYTPHVVRVWSVIATLRGDDPGRGTIVMSSHYDSRASDGNDPVHDAPGADDNGSGTSAVLEAARVLAPHRFPETIVFATFDGEEQGLFGSAHYAKTLHDAGMRVDADFNNDIIGASVGDRGRRAPYDVRVFSAALPAGAQPERVNLLGTENDSPSRELARFAADAGEAYVPGMHVDLVFRADRFLRGGDQESFTDEGFPAIRFTELHETFAHQHQNVRVENGVQYGDLLRYVDFAYLARVTQVNVAGIAAMALAPPPPAPRMIVSALANDTLLRWNAVTGAASYEVVRRATTDATWTHVTNVGNVTAYTSQHSKDNWLFGVRALDAGGRASIVAFPVPARS